MATPGQVDVWVGLDVGQGEHFAALRDPASRAFYDRKRAEGKRHNAALICLARRCDVILATLRTGQPYHPAHRTAALADAP